MESTILSTVNAYLASHEESLRKKDATIVSQELAPEFTRGLAPISFLRAAGLPDGFALTVAQDEEAYAAKLPHLESVSTKLEESVVDVPGKKASAYITRYIKMFGKDEIVVEGALFFWLTEDGTKIKKMIEFTDSVQSRKFMDIAAEPCPIGPRE